MCIVMGLKHKIESGGCGLWWSTSGSETSGTSVSVQGFGATRDPHPLRLLHFCASIDVANVSTNWWKDRAQHRMLKDQCESDVQRSRKISKIKALVI